MSYIELPPLITPYYGDPVAALVNLPTTDLIGTIRLVENLGNIYWWDGATWNLVGTLTSSSVANTNSVNLTVTAGVITADARLSTDLADAGYVLSEVAIRSGASKGFRVQLANSLIRALLSAGGILSYDNTTGIISLTSATVRALLSASGIINYDNTTGIISLTSATVRALLSGSGLISYDNTTGVISLTSATVRALFSGTGLISYDNTTGIFSLTSATIRALLSATAPLTYNSGTGAFGITQSTTSTDGYLSSTDWNTFNAKQPAGNYITALTGDVTASGPGSVAATLKSSASRRYIDFTSGSDSGTGSPVSPWLTLQHAYNATSPTLNDPYNFILSGGNNDTDVGTITGKPNVTLWAEFPIQISVPLTISGGSSNDNIGFVNITCLEAVTWIRNDASTIAVTAQKSAFGNGLTLKQNGAGTCSLYFYDCTTVNLAVASGPTGCFFFNNYFQGTSVFSDANSSAYYQFMGGYSDSQMSISGGAFAYFSGIMIDVPFGATLTAVTTGNGTPSFQFDSAGLPPSVTGSYTPILTSYAQYESYTPTTSANWNSVPGTVLAGLDALATSGIVKSQTANKVLASPSGSSGVPSFRVLTSTDLPTITTASLTAITDGSSAAAGKVNEILTASQATNTTTGVGSTGTYGNAISISLTAGRWLVQGIAGFNENGAVLTTGLQCGISASSSGSGIDEFDTSLAPFLISSTSDALVATPMVYVSIAGTTTYYLNTKFTYTSGTPKHRGKIKALRIG